MVGVNESEKRASSFVKAFASEEHIQEIKQLFQLIKEKEFPNSPFRVEDIEFDGVHADIDPKERQKLIKKFDRKKPGVFIYYRLVALFRKVSIRNGRTWWYRWTRRNRSYKNYRKLAVTRVRERQKNAKRCIVDSVPVDPEKYAQAKTPQEQHQLILSEIQGKDTDYKTFLNVIAALKYQYDPELYRMCLGYSDKPPPKPERF